MSEFSGLLIKYREQVGISCRKLAERMALSASYISRLETGEREPANRQRILDLGESLQLNLDQKNRLLISAGFTPIDIDDMVEADPRLKRLVDILDDKAIPSEEKDMLDTQMQLILKRYKK